MPAQGEATTQVIEGRRTVVSTVDFGLPQKMTELLAQLVVVTLRADLRPTGARQACTVLREHRLRPIRIGRWIPRSGVRRGEVLDVRISMCADCGAVQVRDVSLDLVPGARVGSGGPRRRDHVIGWYSGARPNQREYR